MDVLEIRRLNLAYLVRQHGTQVALGEKIETEPAYISQVLSDKIRADLGPRVARRIEAKLGLAHGWMDHLHVAEEAGTYGNAPDGVEVLDLAVSRVPIVGDTNGGFHRYTEHYGPTDEYVDAPMPHPGVYGLKVRGASCAPRIREGDAITVSPVASVMPGEEVVVLLRDGEHMVKQLVSVRDDAITVSNCIGDVRRVIPRTEIEYVHAVIGIHPASQIKKR